MFGGVFSVLPTPFTSTGDIDFESRGRVIDLFIADGVSGFTALGVTGEVARLTEAERDRVLDAVLGRVNGRVPVVAGTTADGLRTCIEFTQRARRGCGGRHDQPAANAENQLRVGGARGRPWIG